MASKKITELKSATTVTDSDILLVVQDGETKKTSAGNFIKKGQEVNSAKTLEGYNSDDFLKKNETASDSAKLGGVSADQYMKKTDASGSGSTSLNPFWWTPIPYILPDTAYTQLGYIECDGSYLSKDAFPELFAVLGNTYDQTGDNDNTKFRIPDLKGRTMVGTQFQKNNGVIPAVAGRYVQDETVALNDAKYGSDISAFSKETTKKAYMGQFHRIEADAIPQHAHQNGVACVDGGYDTLIMVYGNEAYMDNDRDFEYPYNHRVEGTTSAFELQRVGYTGTSIYKMNDIDDFSVLCDNSHPSRAVNIVQPGLTVTWVMKTKP